MAKRALASPNRSIPELRTHDRFGHRVDVVEYHPHYHELMTLALESGVAALPWGAHRERRGVFSRARRALAHDVPARAGGCPTTMTFAAVPALSTTAAVASEWVPKIVDAPSYDGRDGPKSSGVTIGMSMTEKQGGSDVRANTTVATPVGDGGEGGEYTLRGHKWFTSAPMSDAFLTLAHTAEGVSCFLVPRWLPGRLAECGLSSDATEGEDWRPLERVERGRVRQCVGADGRAPRQGRAHDRRDGGAHAPRLRHRLGRADARVRGTLPRTPLAAPRLARRWSSSR